MAQLTDIFGLDHMTFHEKDGARHEFRPSVEYIYNALPFFFPPQKDSSVNEVKFSKKVQNRQSYGIDGRLSNGHGIVIENGKKYIKR